MFEPAKPAGRAYIGIFGDTGAGKTFMAVEAAILARKCLGMDGPICFFDTERGAPFRSQRVLEATGQSLLTVTSRDLNELRKALGQAIELNASCVIIDSYTHIFEKWREDFFAEHNIGDPEPSDYQKSDRALKDFLTKITMANLNLIVCGREGAVWGRYKNTKGKMVNGPVGVKMAAGKAGYEFDLLMRMEKHELKGGGMERICTVVKDRTDNLHGVIGRWPANEAPNADKVGAVLLPYMKMVAGL